MEKEKISVPALESKKQQPIPKSLSADFCDFRIQALAGQIKIQFKKPQLKNYFF